jgi:hypothetical protein
MITTTNWFISFAQKKSIWILFILWAFMQVALFLKFGINTGGESLNALHVGADLFAGKGVSIPSNYMYFTEAFLVFISMKINAGYGLIIFIQLALNFCALLYLFRFLNNFYASKILAFIGCLLLVVCFPYHTYNISLYTESIFFSLSIFYSCYLLRLHNISLKSIIILLVLLSLLCITRPSGIFFVAATIIYLFFFISKKLSPLKKGVIFISLSIIALLLLNYLMGMGGGIDIILPFKTEQIICEVPTIPFSANIDTVKDGNSLYGLLYYITHNFPQFWRLALLKSKAFFGLVRPYYSTGHNAFLIIYYYTQYAFIIFALIKINRKLPVGFIYFITLILIYWLSVVFSCDEWHNRFFLTLTPFIIIPALYIFKKNTTNL